MRAKQKAALTEHPSLDLTILRVFYPHNLLISNSMVSKDFMSIELGMVLDHEQ